MAMNFLHPLDRLHALQALQDNARSVDDRITVARSLGMSDAEIAAEMGVPEAAVRSRGAKTTASHSGSGAGGAILLLIVLWALSR